MLAQEIAETTGIKQCHACGAELLERDKFCRQRLVGQGVPTSTFQQSSPSRPSSLKSDQDYRAGFIRKIK
jgi:hypothetical protein